MRLLCLLIFAAGSLFAAHTFAVTGAPIPAALLKLNYGNLPNGVIGYDLDICNVSETRQSLTSAEVYQSLSQAGSNLRPLGRNIVLAAILRNQNHSLKSWLTLALTSTTGVLSILGTIHGGRPSVVLANSALGALIGQQLVTSFAPVLAADQVEKFETQVLEPALVMDSRSCVERTVFAASTVATAHKQAHAAAAVPLSFVISH